MKIVPIFAEKLYAFHYEGEKLDEYGRLLEQWNDPEYVLGFAEKNKEYITRFGYTMETFSDCVFTDAERLENLFIQKGISIEACFQPLHNQELGCRMLSLQKKKCRLLRLYAIRIDKKCFVITGGAIKITRTMQEHPETSIELDKLNRCRNYLQSMNVFNYESFYEIIGE